MIPYGHQSISQTDIDKVVAVLQSEYLTQGPVVPAFEKAVAAKAGAQYAVAVNSATSALHIACLALGLSENAILWTVPNSFVASANCARYCGAKVDFVDIDPKTWNISIEKLEEKLIEAKKSNTLPGIVIPVHFAGQASEQKKIWLLAKEYGFKVIEDASHAIGASVGSEFVGSCRWSDITVFSFHPVKIVTAGEGGMALTNDKELASRMNLYRSHGITRDPELMHGATEGPWYYEQLLLGMNYRMTDIHAALGLSQLSRLDTFVDKRNALAEIYTNELADLPLSLPHVELENRSAFHLYVVRLKLEEVEHDYRSIFEGLRGQGIGVNLHYMPIHLQPYYRDLGFTEGMFPESEQHGKEAITLPLYPDLTEDAQHRVIAALRSLVK